MDHSQERVLPICMLYITIGMFIHLLANRGIIYWQCSFGFGKAEYNLSNVKQILKESP